MSAELTDEAKASAARQAAYMVENHLVEDAEGWAKLHPSYVAGWAEAGAKNREHFPTGFVTVNLPPAPRAHGILRRHRWSAWGEPLRPFINDPRMFQKRECVRCGRVKHRPTA